MTPQENRQFNILQVNISGLQNKKEELAKMMHDHNIRIALIQETILPRKPINISGYTQYKCNCNTKCRGIMTLIRNDTQAKVSNTTLDSGLDTQKISFWVAGKQYTAHNIYWSPNSTKSDLNFTDTLFTRTLLAGDLNAHSPSWGYKDYNPRGKEVESLCNGSNLILMQNAESKPTLLHRASGATTRPDLTMISADIVDICQVTVMDDIGGSDHRPILTTITHTTQKQTRNRTTLWNFRKANWTRYQTAALSGLKGVDETKDINTVYNQIQQAILSAARKTIPRGNRKQYKPFWNKELQELVKDRRRARKRAEKDPTRENKTAYNRLTGQVRYKVRTSKRNHWTDTCNQLDLRKQGHKAWGLLHSLEGKKAKTNPQPIERDGRLASDNKKKANIFNKHFAQVNQKLPRKGLDETLTRILKANEKKPSASIRMFETDFTMGELKTAVRKLKARKTPGPDKVTNEMISNLNTEALSILLKYINRTWRESKLPTAWLTATIQPILKKDKPPNEPKSYRPISLTSCVGKLAERMVNTRLYWWLENTKSLDNHQAGFRKGCRTEDQLFRFVQETMDGFQDHRHTTAVFIDLQQAYDRVWRQGLFMKMNKLGIHGKMYSWIQAFLRNRTINTSLNGTISKKRTLQEGLPQGSSLSCTLFLIFLNDLPPLLKVSKALYADDLVIWVSEKYPILARGKLKRALATIGAYCNLWKLKLNTQKTTYSIFTRSPKVAKEIRHLKINGEIIEKEDNPNYLGITLDRQLTLSNFVKKLKEKATQRLNLVKRLASLSWGASKQTLRQLYLGYVRSIMDYGQALQTTASKTAISHLDRVQNQALRLICGGLRTTPTAACEIEANIEPMDLRRERSTLEATERYKRLPADHPNRQQIEKWKQKNRLQQVSPIQAAVAINKKHRLPTNREPIQNHSTVPPGEEPKTGQIELHLSDPSISKNSNPVALKTAALETIDSYRDTAIHIYTDGSAFKATTNAGAGILLKYPDGSTVETSIACGRHCSNYTAEIQAIDYAITTIHSQFIFGIQNPTDAVIFTDSQSALQALSNITTETDKDISTLAKNIDKLLRQYNIHVTLQWIPGHSDVHGNEKADALAKQGTIQGQPDKPVSIQTTRQILKSNTKEEWLNRWAVGTTGRAMYREMSTPTRKDSINTLSRRDQCLIFQWRTTHARVNQHLNRTDPLRAPLCRHCSAPYETTKHILLECPQLQPIREQLLPPQPYISNTLYASVAQLSKTCKFIRLSLPE